MTEGRYSFGHRAPLLFRCTKCKRGAHVTCLPDPEDITLDDISDKEQHWLGRPRQCPQCDEWSGEIDIILAWREIQDNSRSSTPTSATSLPEPPSAKDDSAAAEYLVKWKEGSYRSVEWLPHAFVYSAFASKLRVFLKNGPRVVLASRLDESVDAPDGELDVTRVQDFSLAPDPQAISKIPREWTTIGRVLDVQFRNPKGGPAIPIEKKRDLSEDPSDSIDDVSWCFVKYQGLAYSAGKRLCLSA
jgi:chromodomain-helicase-DNA-binding protein 4